MTELSDFSIEFLLRRDQRKFFSVRAVMRFYTLLQIRPLIGFLVGDVIGATAK
jgi:hypothetical protein